MPRPLILSLDGNEFSVSLVKIDREKLYGAVEIEAFDEKGNEASLKVLAADGKTLIDKGGTALSTISEDGSSLDRTELSPVDIDNHEIESVPSSFGTPNVLSPATSEDYLAQIVKSVYLLRPFPGESLDVLYENLGAKRIFQFEFSYRGGVDYDSAFLVGSKSDAFMIVGKQAELQYVKLNQAAVLESVEEEEISADDIDFDLL
ncbi:MAG: hypothetical protein H7070_03835 [Saprospiraceae bacterium]|nr:hypothetical protein [Pyrinomonadaceae bacterium]